MKKILKQKRTRQLRKARTRAKIFGTALRPRLSVFRSNQSIWVQLIDDENGKTLAAASSRSQTTNASESTNMNKTEAARKAGKEIAEQAKKLKISAAVFDRGGYRYHGRVKAVAEGARSVGLSL